MSSGDFYEKSKVNTVSIMERLFQTKARTADVHFVFEVNGVPTHRISAHRNVLAMGSPIFDEMFFGPDKHFIEGDIPTRSSTITSYTFEAFIALFYGKWESITLGNCADILRLSQNFGAKYCEEACSEFKMEVDSEVLTIDR